MTIVKRSAYAPYSCEQMYALVNDVSAYPRFLPWCTGASVLAAGEQSVRARLAVRKGPLDLAFTTENRLEPPRSITLALVDGPFRKLAGQWRFEPADGGCLVSLVLEFEFGGRVVGGVLANAFKPLADSLVDAFRQRAGTVYGV